MKFMVGHKIMSELHSTYGPDGLFYFLVGLITMILINCAISFVPTGVAYYMAEDNNREIARHTLVISVIALLIIELIVF